MFVLIGNVRCVGLGKFSAVAQVPRVGLTAETKILKNNFIADADMGEIRVIGGPSSWFGYGLLMKQGQV